MLALLVIPFLLLPATSMPEVQERDDVENQNEEECRHERDAAQPREHIRAVAGAARRLRYSNDVMKSTE